MKILGIDPGLVKTGWGILEAEDNRLTYIASGLIKPNSNQEMAQRLQEIDEGLQKIITEFDPGCAAIEETFVNKNPASALKLGLARGVAMACPARLGLRVGEYPANLVKKSVVGAGKASKDQVGVMIKTLLPACGDLSEDEADALAVAITHAHHRESALKFGGKLSGAIRG